ncbi:hypothetical protein RQP46_008105 [Phenoliferia psychrophenolica]
MATIHSLAPEILSGIFELAHDPHKPSAIPPVQNSSNYISEDADGHAGKSRGPTGDLPRTFATVQHLYHFTLNFDPSVGVHRILIAASSIFESLAGSLPTSIKRLSITNVRGASDRTHLALSETQLAEIKDLFSNNRLPNLTRIDFPDCSRKDLEDEAEAADLLHECECRSIRVVCWEEFL